MRLLRKKYLYKTISWRLISIVLSFTVSYWFMGDWQIATQYTFVYSVFSTLLYYGHELFYRWLKEKGRI